MLRFSAVRCSDSLLYGAQVLCCTVLRFSAVQSGDIFGIKGLGMCSVVMRGGPVALILVAIREPRINSARLLH